MLYKCVVKETVSNMAARLIFYYLFADNACIYACASLLFAQEWKKNNIVIDRLVPCIKKGQLFI